MLFFVIPFDSLLQNLLVFCNHIVTEFNQCSFCCLEQPFLFRFRGRGVNHSFFRPFPRTSDFFDQKFNFLRQPFYARRPLNLFEIIVKARRAVWDFGDRLEEFRKFKSKVEAFVLNIFPKKCFNIEDHSLIFVTIYYPEKWLLELEIPKFQY